MDPEYTEEQLSLRESIIRFAREELNDRVEDDDRDGVFPADSWRKCAEMQIMALPFPEEYGGFASDFRTTIACYNALGYACRDAGLVHAVGTQIMCGIQVLSFGTQEQKEKYLPGICSGNLITAQAITEPGTGSDALGMRARAVRDRDDYVIDGNKMFITNGPIADLIVVFAVTDPDKKTLGGISAFLVEGDTDGLERCRSIEKMGLRTLQNGELVFDGCRISERAILGKEGQGAIIFNESMDWERLLLPAAHLGTMERVLETCVLYAKERRAFGQPIGKYQAVSHKIADMKMNLEMGKLMLDRAARLKDDKKRVTMEAAIAKLFISESLKSACLDGVQIHGGYGYMAEYDIERDLRDSIASTIYSGTSEMQRNIISRLLGV
jgi:alkylation response protein AidB-like acyl-CoA dehydrogenase